jgi:signal transduction histidine kinase
METWMKHQNLPQQGLFAVPPGLPVDLARYQALHRIDQSILGLQDDRQIADRVLNFLPDLLPEAIAAWIYLVQEPDQEPQLVEISRMISEVELAPDLPERSLPLQPWLESKPELLEGELILSGFPAGFSLKQGQPIIDVEQFQFILAPILSGQGLSGLLQIALPAAVDPLPPDLWVVNEIAGSLALALGGASKQKAEQERLREAELMRDIMGALASSADLNQTLEIILVNLRSLVSYDQARLFLLDNSSKSQALADLYPEGHAERGVFPADDPVVTELQSRREALIVPDLALDERFANWLEMQTVHGWMGVPIFAGDEMIGFLSLGSLQVDHYGDADAELVQIFANQIGRILERAWLHEQSHRQSEELEVLSKITYALGQVDSQESIFPAIIDQVSQFYGALGGTFLFPDKFETGMYVRHSQNSALTGMVLSDGENVFWDVYHSGQVVTIANVPAYLKKHAHELYERLFEGGQFAAVIPLKSQEITYGVLLLLFRQASSAAFENLRLLDTVAAIAGTFLHRAIFLEALEKQLNVRTRHLTALYQINQIAGQAFDTYDLVAELLQISLEVMGSRSGAILLLDIERGTLDLAAQQQLPAGIHSYFQQLPLSEPFWEEMLNADGPLVIPNLSEELRLPPQFRSLDNEGQNACLLAPVKAGKQPLGLITILPESILGYSIEDITLFINIADQIGSAIERTRLVKKARQAAIIEERQRLARELHDSVTQLIYSQVLFAGAGLRVLDRGNLELLQQNLERIDLSARQALKEMRLLVYELRPLVYLQEGLVTALEHRLEAVEKRSGINAELIVDGELDLDESVELSLYRIIEEALNNTLKHSSAHNVSIRIQETSQELLIEIIDDGCGFDTAHAQRRSGMGLQNMRERTDNLGGEMNIHSLPGDGTRLSVRIGFEK